MCAENSFLFFVLVHLNVQCTTPPGVNVYVIYGPEHRPQMGPYSWPGSFSGPSQYSCHALDLMRSCCRGGCNSVSGVVITVDTSDLGLLWVTPLCWLPDSHRTVVVVGNRPHTRTRGHGCKSKHGATGGWCDIISSCETAFASPAAGSSRAVERERGFTHI